MDQADLMDSEIAEIGEIWKRLNSAWMTKPNTRSNLQEFAKVANAEFLKAGFVVNVQWENTLIMVPNVNAPGGMAPMPVTIEVLGRVSGEAGVGGYKEDGHVLMDHEKKRDEVIKARERGEKFLGEKGKRKGD